MPQANGNFFAGLSEDLRQTYCRWQQLIQTKSVLQIPPSPA